MHRQFVTASLALGIAAMAASAASATALYTVEADCGVPTQIVGSTTPVSTSGTCISGSDSIFTSAASSEGHVGVASTLSGLSAGTGGTLFALFTTPVTFTATAGSTATTISVALNLSLDGTATSSGTSFTHWRAFGGITSEVGGSFDIGSQQDLSGIHQTSTGIASGPTETIAIGSDTVSGTMTTNTFDVQVGVPLLLSLELMIDSGGTSDMEFLHSLDLPTGSDVFTLPVGFTVNDDSGIIVNDRFGPAAAVPEPSTLLLLAAGLVSFGALRRPT